MGNCFSTPRKEAPRHKVMANAVNGAGTSQAISNGTFDKPDTTGSTQDPPPRYVPPEVPTSDIMILQMFKKVQDFCCDSIGVKSGLNGLRHQTVYVWVDDNPKLPPETTEAIEFVSKMLLIFGKALEFNMKIYFMGYSNNNSNELSEDKRERAAALRNLFEKKTYHEATGMIKGEPILSHEDLQIPAWFEKMEESRRTSRLNDDETHTKLLAHVQWLREPYRQGWRQEDLKVEDFSNLYKEARTAVNQQPKKLNNICFTIQQAIAFQQRLQKGADAQATSVIILTGSPLFGRDAKAIKRDQGQVTGGADEFSIQTLLFCDNLERPSIEIHRQIDNNFKGDKDIYDVSELSERKVLDCGLSEIQLVKIFNSSNPAVDRLKFRKDGDKYGPCPLGGLDLPSVEQTKGYL
ncbi:hypothetical protein BGZ63DRAFT_379421 [Mariannaea sp. PMI_226]|nr:hypothetical protein BGZ63DRAFT_379421 [Mariannaea sp. PMI_226]